MMLTEMPLVYAGSGFPWGLLIIGGILYLLWRNGAFDGRGRHGNHGGYGGYGGNIGPGPGPQGMSAAPNHEHRGAPVFGGTQADFDAWHRQAHAAETPQAPAAPAAPAAPTAPAAGTGESMQ
jgi:hypothetical protein